MFDSVLDFEKQISCSVDDVLRLNSTEAVRLIEDAVVKAGAAPHLGADYHAILRTAGSEPDGIGGTEYGHHRNREEVGQMHRTAVVANKHLAP